MKQEIVDPKQDFMDALDELEKDRGINKEIIIDTIEQALLTAYKKNFGSAQNVRVEVDREDGEVRVFSQRRVVDESDLYDTFLEIELADARKIDPSYELGDIIENEVTPKDFGRIAAQTAKQVVVQRIREAEREIVYNEFIEKETEIVTGEIARATSKTVYVNVGKIEASMPESEQIPGEEYKAGQKIKVYILEVKKTNKGPQIVVSRSHPGLVKRLFEKQVEEIYQGIVQIKSVSREAGSRTKIAVQSIDERIDPIGACVGTKGSRVRAVVDELGGEKIDIINYSDDPAEFISAALSPSKVVRVDVNEEEKTALVVVPDYQLSLAIGKSGQNARLAAKLTNWKIDIKSESQIKEEMELKAEEAIEDDFVEEIEATPEVEDIDLEVSDDLDSDIEE
ncbi:MAG: transcription termination factor NusA [Intestinibacter sp.]|uniref:transcription termination factor NusA n=1 Tax=Intestinibacter sp. TaxID=1965304 RepID=UPI0025C592DB|nr:transcription termination factor NusA [Intestinibacter sp.]MCI6738738.1 transcription termination factor NusA [Intestinibacter sp.]